MVGEQVVMRVIESLNAFTYYFSSGSIRKCNDYDWKSGIVIQCSKKPFVKVRIRDWLNRQESERKDVSSFLIKELLAVRTEGNVVSVVGSYTGERPVIHYSTIQPGVSYPGRHIAAVGYGL